MEGRTVFCHADSLVDSKWLKEGDTYSAKVVEDRSKGEGKGNAMKC